MTNKSLESFNVDIHDRVNEAYYGELGEKLQEQTQRRMHWIRDNVKSRAVLDIGCSQGIGPILLGRKGINVTGIDISQKSVDEANESLEKEPHEIQEIVSFKCEDFLSYDSEQVSFDTITITEVLEHLYEPEAFIEKSKDLLNAEGMLIVTVPFGINDHIDHKKTYYFHDLYKMLYQYFDIQEISILGRWIGIVAIKRQDLTPLKAQSIGIDQLHNIEEAFYDIEREGVNLNALYREQRDSANQKYKELWDKVRHLSSNIVDLQEAVRLEKDRSNQLKQRVEKYDNFVPIKFVRNLMRRTKRLQNVFFNSSKIKKIMSKLSYLDSNQIHQIVEMPSISIGNPQASDLVISYCFTPYVDTSAIVMAKRIIDNNKRVDVVHADMSSARSKDESLSSLTADLVSNRIELCSEVSFSSWSSIQSFCDQMMHVFKDNSLKPYSTVYSRAMWPASHFAAFAYKMENRDTEWVAEFSDPLLYDIHSKERISKITNKQYLAQIRKALEEKKIPISENNNIFFWCEYLPYIFAQKLIFTNPNQLQYMLGKLEPWLQEMVRSKAEIKTQPVLPHSYYFQKESTYSLDHTKVNLAYFGAFYQTRKLNDIVLAVKKLSLNDSCDRLCMHVFTNNKDDLTALVEQEDLADYFRINSYVGFLEFLNLTTKFDCLVLNDAITKPHKPINPYLPSKLSDYQGSATPIWALYEEGSIIQASKDISYKSLIGDVDSSCAVLEDIIKDSKKNG